MYNMLNTKLDVDSRDQNKQKYWYIKISYIFIKLVKCR